MKTAVRRVSIDAYRKHIRERRALAQWMRVLQYIEQHPNVTRAQIERDLQMRTGSVCGRVKELLDSRLVKHTGPIRCPVTGENAHGLRVATQDERDQGDLFEVAA